MDLENCLQVQSVKVKKNGLKELYLGSEFNSNEEWIENIESRYKV